MLDTPVLFIVFNRPDTAAKVFERIRAVQPKQLYIIADGPRQHVPEDAENCRKTREIVSLVDWECEVKTDFKANNVGPEVSIKSGLNWFFNEVEYGIILEDDCLPDLSFFEYCERLLRKFRYDDHINIISGCTFIDKKLSADYDYFIGELSYSWGWASWARVFKNLKWGQYYDLENVYSKLFSAFGNKEYADLLFCTIEHSHNKEGNWDVELLIHNLMNDKKSVTPAVNLVSNIGETGTHYTNSKNKILFVPTARMEFSEGFEERYIKMPGTIKEKIISNFIKLYNPLTLRDRLYLTRVKLLRTISSMFKVTNTNERKFDNK
jgi:hypothetical protein